MAAVTKDALTHFLDKDWMTVDPTNPKRIFVTYTDVDTSGAVCPTTGGGARLGIELVRSTDGGATWSSPVVIQELCSPPPDFPFVQGSQVAVGPGGEIYVAWESFSGPAATIREIDISKSTNHGVSFASHVEVTDVIQVGDGNVFQGGFRNNEFPMLAIDQSGTKTKGNLYIAWNDGRDLQVPDFEPPNGVYGYADVLLARSKNGGATWSAPVRVNSNPKLLSSGRGSDQFMPGVAVDGSGAVAACWYDRRRDPLNFLVDRFCGISKDAGKTFTNKRETTSSWAPWHAVDALINPFYMGDYDSVTSDSTTSAPGFIGAFEIMQPTGGTPPTSVFVPNPDVFAVKLR